jgi:glutamate synthase domain-containing protein 3
MTNGSVVILGKTGKNFGAGMSGGTAYIYDVDGKFYSRVNSEMVVALPIKRAQDIAEVKALIELHHERTGSMHAANLLTHWEETTHKLVRVSSPRSGPLAHHHSCCGTAEQGFLRLCLLAFNVHRAWRQ